jgi:hypothetical protein
MDKIYAAVITFADPTKAADIRTGTDCHAIKSTTGRGFYFGSQKTGGSQVVSAVVVDNDGFQWLALNVNGKPADNFSIHFEG